MKTAFARVKNILVHFINKIQIVLEEADECHYWLEIIYEIKLT